MSTMVNASSPAALEIGAEVVPTLVTIDQHHPLFLQPNDTPGSSLISIKLTGPENYALWSGSMRISLLGKSKLGFVDGRYPKEKFDVSLHDLWEKCNAIVLSWIMNSVCTELLSGIIYATSAYKVWTDLQERFDKVNGSRVFFLHSQISTLNQGISSVSTYFSKLRELWAEFDALMPCPGCNCAESRKYVEHFKYQRLLQFLMGLNESYSQSINHIIMMLPTPSINKAYAMIISEESRRSLGSSSYSSEIAEGTTLFSGKSNSSVRTNYQGNKSSYKGRSRRNDLYCDHCHLTGHTKAVCYKLIGYPPDYKFKKKTGSYIKENETSKGNPNSSDIGNQFGGQCANFAGSSHMSKGSTDAFGAIPQFTEQQYKQILTMLDSEKSEADHVALTAGMIPHTTITSDDVKWIVDYGASSHTVSFVELLSHTTTVNKNGLGKVHLPTGNVVNVTHTGSSCLFPGQEITNVMHIPEFKYNLLSVSQLTKELQCAVLFYPDFCILQDLSSGKVKGIGKEESGL